jgi:DNA-binding CsgD family transcriptional regulator/GGDEF domain-containing protein
VVLDNAGTIIVTNASWREGAARRGGNVASTGPGVNYLDVCERSDDGFVADGIEAVLRGRRLHFEYEYSCHSSIADSWFIMDVAPLGEPGAGVLITHTDVTAQVVFSRRGGHGRDVDPVTLLATSPSGVTGLAHKLADSQSRGHALAVVTVTLANLGEIQSLHGRRIRDDLVVHTAARILRLARGDDEMMRPATNQLVLFSSVADAQGAEFLREQIGHVLTVPYLVGATALAVRADVSVSVSDRFSTVGSLLSLAPTPRAPSQALLGTVSAIVPGALGVFGAPGDRSTRRVGTGSAASAGGAGSMGGAGSIGSAASRGRAGGAGGVESVPLVVYSLPDGYLQTANSSAQALLGLAQAGSTNLHAADIADPADARHVSAAMAALGSGALDSYRGRRTSVTPDGTRVLHTAVRRMIIGREALAVALTVATETDAEVQAVDQRLAVALVAGTIDTAGVITTVSPSTTQTEVGLKAALRGSLQEAVHPDDVASVREMIESMRRGRDVAGVVRLAPAEHGWMNCQIQLFSLKCAQRHSTGQPVKGARRRYGFVVSTAVDASSVAEKLARLEEHLRRIGSEVYAAQGDLRSNDAPDRSVSGILDGLELTVRQREIVERLAAGQRVSSIAAALYISRSTVRNHLAQVYRLVGVHSQEELLDVLHAS